MEARGQAVKLPGDLFERLQARDREEADRTYSKWKDVLDKAQANRAARLGTGRKSRGDAWAKKAGQQDARGESEPLVEEEL